MLYWSIQTVKGMFIHFQLMHKDILRVNRTNIVRVVNKQILYLILYYLKTEYSKCSLLE